MYKERKKKKEKDGVIWFNDDEGKDNMLQEVVL